MINILGTLAFGTSFFLRLRGSSKVALPFSTLGYALILTGGDLGGHLVYNFDTLVSREAFSSAPEKFTSVLAVADLDEGKLKRIEANGMAILLTRVEGRIYALGDTCTHWGCSLAEGKLRDGAVLQGPASAPELSFDVRERAGQIQVRLSAGSDR